MADPRILDVFIESAIDSFDLERSKGWDDPEFGEHFVSLSDRIAELTLESSHSLLNDTEGWMSIDELVERAFEMRADFVESLQVQLARRYLTGAAGMADRALELLRLSASIKPKAQVRRFLESASRCYLLGLTAECSIMCGASLENAVNERIELVDLKFLSDGPTFSKKVSYCIDRGWLSERDRGPASTVWLRRCKSAHEDPTVVRAAFELVSSTAVLLTRLYRDT